MCDDNDRLDVMNANLISNDKPPVTTPIQLVLKSVDNGSMNIVKSEEQREEVEVRIATCFGSTDTAFTSTLMAQVFNQLPQTQISEQTLNGILGALAGIAPQDETEAMLAVQMVGIHLASMEALRKARAENATFEGRNMNLKHSGQLTRTYTQQLDALKKYRAKAHQTVQVEHVHVHEGGQAIVGDVNPQADGGRGGKEKGD